MFMPYNTEHERTEAAWLVDTILGHGNAISINNGEEWMLKRSTDRDAILAAMGSTDNDTVKVRDPSGKVLGLFWIVYGNSSGELLTDGTVTDYTGRIFSEYSSKFPL